MNSSKIYRLKITLRDSSPAIWRVFTVPATINLDDLHDVIQPVMGWDNSHLYDFTINKQRYTSEPEFDDEGLESSDYQLCDLISRNGQKLTYLYDFGDNWLHDIVVESTNHQFERLMPDIICLDGERACPPEDVGGIFNYHKFCEIIEDPTHPEYQSYIDWLGKDFKPGSFKLDDINYSLMLLNLIIS